MINIARARGVTLIAFLLKFAPIERIYSLRVNSLSA